MIEELNTLKEELSKIERPSSITEFCKYTKLTYIAEKVEVILKNVCIDEPSLHLKKEDVFSLFQPKEGIYAKTTLKQYQGYWEKGIKLLTDHIDNCIKSIQLKQKYVKQNNNTFINESLIVELKNISNDNFDTKKLILYLEEVNFCFQQNRFLACILLLRAFLNYIPPIFGYNTFAQVTSQSGRSLKDIFNFLEEGLRKIADLHTHKMISKVESIPTNSTINPYKPQCEVLIQEIIVKLKSS